jgi:hypothetical protein
LRIDPFPRLGLDVPSPSIFVIMRGRDSRVELDVLLEVESVGDEVQPSFGLGLGREAFGRHPRLVEILREPILVDFHLRVETGAGIAVPVPSPADARGDVVGADVQSHLAKAMKLIEARDPRADDQCVELGRRGAIRRFAIFFHGGAHVVSFLVSNGGDILRLAFRSRAQSRLPARQTVEAAGRGVLDERVKVLNEIRRRAAVESQAEAFRLRAAGVVPSRLRITRVRWAWSEKPHAKATALTGRLPRPKRSRADRAGGP